MQCCGASYNRPIIGGESNMTKPPFSRELDQVIGDIHQIEEEMADLICGKAKAAGVPAAVREQQWRNLWEELNQARRREWELRAKALNSPTPCPYPEKLWWPPEKGQT
jgi:hypothetical protein